MTYKEKLTKIAADYGISEKEYFNMIKNEVVIDGMIIWAVIVIFLLALIAMIIFTVKKSKDSSDFGEVEFYMFVTIIVAIINVAIFIVSGAYSTPLNKTFNTEYEVIKKIEDMEVE